MTTLAKSIYKLNVIPIKILTTFFTEIIIIQKKITWNQKTSWKSKAILSIKNN